jgi:hypothetical protein
VQKRSHHPARIGLAFHFVYTRLAKGMNCHDSKSWLKYMERNHNVTIMSQVVGSIEGKQKQNAADNEGKAVNRGRDTTP